MRILGVDPGLHITGYGLIEAEGQSFRLLEGGVVRPDSRLSLERRLFQLYKSIRALIQEFQPDYVVVEELYSQYAHPRTAILMGHARGVILLAAAECGIPFYGYEATLVKRSLTGRGRASKQQVGRMVAQLLGLAEPPVPEDVTDALALALCHACPKRLEFAPHRKRRSLPEAIARQIES